MAEAVALFVLLFVKHFIADFVIQTPYQYRNKGTFAHPGGLLHSLYHAVLTTIALGLMILVSLDISVWLMLLIAFGEFVVHYLIDYAKTNINRHKGWQCNESDSFWVLTGLDQLLHYLTYAAIVVIALS